MHLTAVMFWACRLANSWSSCALVDMLLCSRCYDPSKTSRSCVTCERAGVLRDRRSSPCATLLQHAHRTAAARPLLVREFLDKAVSLRHALGR
jgi:hypothetical protein